LGGEWRGIWKYLGVATSTPSDLFKMNKPNMIDDIGSLRIKCINLESEILVLKKELASSQAEVEFWKTKAYEAEESEGKLEEKIQKLKEIK